MLVQFQEIPGTKLIETLIFAKQLRCPRPGGKDQLSAQLDPPNNGRKLTIRKRFQRARRARRGQQHVDALVPEPMVR